MEAIRNNRSYIKSDQRKETYDEYEKKEWSRNTPLQVKKVENGYVLPPKYIPDASQELLSKPTMGRGGVITSEKQFVEYSACKAEHLVQISALTRDRFGGYYEPEGEIPYRDESVIYCGIFWRQWGHFLLDQITRLWYVLEANSNCKLIWLTPSEEADPMKGNFREFFRLLGIDVERCEFVKKVTQFREIMVPEPSYFVGGYYTKEYSQALDQVINRALEEYRGNTYEKIYFSRAKFSKANGSEIGEKSIERIFEKNGYKIIYPEEKSLVEQIALIHNCKVFASMEGTVAHNILFAEQGTEQYIVNRGRIINPFQTQINDMKKISFIAIDAWEELCKPISLKKKPGSFWADPHLIVVNSFFKQFCRDMQLEYGIKEYNVIIHIINCLKYYLFYFKLLYFRPLKSWIKKTTKKMLK